jgi:pimeloyl-ACP methyl ester carboxylesterase
MTARFPYLGVAEQGFEVCARAALLEYRTIEAGDGRPLATFTAGPASAPVVLVVNPLGASCLFFAKLIERLVRTRRVVTWESRGLTERFPEAPAGDHEWAPDTQVGDLAAVLAAAKVARVESVIAYCSGSYTALYAAATGAITASRIALISPPLEVEAAGPGDGRTLYQQTVPPLLSRIARHGPKTAAVIRAILRQGSHAAPGDPDYELHVLNNLPFRGDDSTYRYASLHAAWHHTPWRDLLANLDAQTAIFHGTDDDLVHTDTVTALTAAIRGAELRVYERQGHFAVYTCEALIGDVVRFSAAEGALP